MLRRFTVGKIVALVAIVWLAAVSPTEVMMLSLLAAASVVGISCVVSWYKQCGKWMCHRQTG
jgi:hypothetical protein